MSYGGAYFGNGSGPILHNLNCYGYESDISSCPSSGWYTTNCVHGEDVGVNCYQSNMKAYVYVSYLMQTIQNNIYYNSVGFYSFIRYVLQQWVYIIITSNEYSLKYKTSKLLKYAKHR